MDFLNRNITKKSDRPEKDSSVSISPVCHSQQYEDNKLQSNLSLLEQTYGHYDDRVIWDRFRSGEESVFTYIYYKHFALLCRYGSQFTASKDLVKDHIHDLFIELSDRRAKLSATTSIKFYLMKCLKNRMVAARKKRKIFLSEDPGGFDFDISFSIEHTMIQEQGVEERNRRLNKAIRKLSKRQREVVYYFYFEELTLEEIMELMDCGNSKSIQNLLYRAIHHLKEYISINVTIILFQMIY